MCVEPPGPYTVILKECPDFLLNPLVNADKVLIIRGFSIHIDNANYAQAVAFIEVQHSFVIIQQINRPTHYISHKLDLIMSNKYNFIHQSDDSTNQYLITHALRTVEVNCIARHQHGRTITSNTRDRFADNLPEFYHLVTIQINQKSLDDMTSEMGTFLTYQKPLHR